MIPVRDRITWHIEHDGFNWWLVRDDCGGFVKAGNKDEAERLLRQLNDTPGE